MYFPTYPAGTTHSRLVSRPTPPNTSTVPNPGFGPLRRHRCEEVRPGSLHEKYVWMLITREATGLGYCIQHSIRLSSGSDRSRILIFSAYQRDMMVSKLYENGFKASVATLGMNPWNTWTAPDDGSWLHAHWPSTLMEKAPGITFLAYRCMISGREPCLAWGSPYRISSRPCSPERTVC